MKNWKFELTLNSNSTLFTRKVWLQNLEHLTILLVYLWCSLYYEKERHNISIQVSFLENPNSDVVLGSKVESSSNHKFDIGWVKFGLNSGIESRLCYWLVGLEDLQNQLKAEFINNQLKNANNTFLLLRIKIRVMLQGKTITN